jgi:protein-S-isoprenylcysteine O-methyltransferase Ste14
MRDRAGWRLAFGVAASALFSTVLMLAGWGDARSFLAHPARAGTLVLSLLAAPVVLRTAGTGPGVKSVPDERWFFPVLGLYGLGVTLLLPFLDARSLASLPGGDVLRYAGLVVFAVGAFLRAVSMWVLGPRFAGVVALQEGHRLETRGLYARVRHPSYLGLLLVNLGLVGVFRSALGLALLPVPLLLLVRRIRREEEFLLAEFGDDYRAYRARTACLLPGVY